MSWKMKLLTLSLLTMLGLMIVVYAATIQIRYYYPQTVSVGKKIALLISIEGVEWKNDTTMDWGAISSNGTYAKLLGIRNIGNIPTNVSVVIINLPQNISLTWDWNNTVLSIYPPDYERFGDLTLTTGTIKPGTYNWGMYIIAKEVP